MQRKFDSVLKRWRRFDALRKEDIAADRSSEEFLARDLNRLAALMPRTKPAAAKKLIDQKTSNELREIDANL